MVVSHSTETQQTNETSTKNKTGTEQTLTTFGTRTRTRFGTWNVRTMLEATKLAQIAREFRSYKLELLGLSETRWKQSGERRLSTGETLFYSGKPETEDHSSGVGFLLSKKAKLCLTEWNPVSDRIISLRLQTKVRHLTFIQVYAPTEQAPDDVKDAFYQQLVHTLNNVKKSDILVLMGDLNAQVGSSNENWEAVMGTHGLGTMNENGELFAELCGNHGLVIGGTLFKHLNIHKVTWVSPDRRTENQIDHIAISGKWKSSLLDVRNRRGADVYSDHHLLTGAMRIKLSTHRKREPTAPKRLDIGKLKDRQTAERFIQSVSETVSSNRQADDDVAAKWSTVNKALQHAGEQTLGYRNNERKEWISDTTWNKIEERKKWKQTIISTNDNETKRQATQKYNELAKEVKRKARADKRKWANDIAEQAQRAADSNNMRETYRLARRISGKRPDADKPVRAVDGSLITTDSEQSERWSTHFEELLNKPPVAVPQSPTEPIAQRIFNVSSPTSSEIKSAIKQLKNNKAPGADNIAAEMLKVDLEVITNLLHPIVSEVWETEIIPEEFTDALIIKLAKKGDLTFCSNWRGITLLNTINKIISIIIHDRISKVLEPMLRKQQAGFRPHRSCIDNINTLRIIMEQSVEFNTPLYLLFVDFKQAFDSLDRNVMWNILSSYGIPAKILNLIIGLYRSGKCRVVHRGKLGRWFTVDSGVKQGCVLSPLLFLLVLDWVMRKVNNGRRGIQWTLTERLEDIDFADDLALMAQRASDMEESLPRLVRYAGQVGLKVNVIKTKLMRINTTVPCTLTIEGKTIGEVESFCYLGSFLSKDGGADLDVRSRIQKARQAFISLNNIWNSSQLTRNLKLRFFKSNCLSVLLYGCETWKVTSTIENQIQVFVNRCLRRILRIRWPEIISNAELWSTTKVEQMKPLIKRRKWNWIGHTIRRPAGDIARAALDWNPQGTRKRGRPKQTWKRTVVDEARSAKKEWTEVKALAMNRVRWRLFVDALCSPAE